MKLLIVEAEIGMQSSINAYFKKSGYTCEIAVSDKSVEEKIRMNHYDCVIMDLPLLDGRALSILEKINRKEPKVGIIILSNKKTIQDKVQGLDLGADDYLVKPFHFAELKARVSAIVRRLKSEENQQIQVGNLAFHLDAQRIFIAGKEVFFKRKEYELLLFFVSNIGRIISKPALSKHIWGVERDSTDSFDFLYSQVKNLKKNLEEFGCDHNLRSVYGLGYKFELDRSKSD